MLTGQPALDGPEKPAKMKEVWNRNP